METEWPLPRFSFQVKWAEFEISCQEASGLDGQEPTIEYRHGDSPEFVSIKMPGLKNFGNVTLRKAVAKADPALLALLNQIKMNTINRAPITIRLLDEGGKPAMTWILVNAWPAKITGLNQKSDGKDVAIDTIEIAHEGVTIVNA